MVVTINYAKLKDIAYSTFPQDAEGTEAGRLFKAAFTQLESIGSQAGCKCKQKKPRRLVYEDTLHKLGALTDEDINVLKTFLNAKTIILVPQGQNTNSCER
mgnify:CR=1 FL=1|jgi:hypothetical protein|tara:strand:+ start:343 stop:645 length:303 start_codon:yes stop_codon:yes gene_type:complete